MNSNITPLFGSTIFCDGIRSSDSGKIDCHGVFTSILVWAYPSVIRTWYSIVTMYNVPDNGCSLTVSVVDSSGKRIALKSVDVDADSKNIGSVVALPLSHVFTKDGDHSIEYSIVGTTLQHTVPLRTVIQEWPVFSDKDKEYLRAYDTIPKSLMATVLCNACSGPHIFQATPLDDIIPAVGVTPFPESGYFECCSCGSSIPVKDIEGQILSSIKSLLRQAMGE